jgi:site-specific DNA recombinase
MKALIYCRVSSEKQKTEGHGLDSQEQRCRLYCEQKGYEVEGKPFRDSFTGAGDFMDRPAMRALLGYLDKHPHRTDYIVIFDDLKRFARDTIFHLKLRREFKARGVKVECLNYKFDESEEGEFIETVLAAQGELERKQNRRQVIQKQRSRLELGYWPFCHPPGYRAIKTVGHGKLLTPYEPEATIIKTALEGFAVDRFETQGDVLRYFESEKFCGKEKILFQLVSRLFMRLPIYAGFIEYAPWEISRRQGHHQPIIDLDTFRRICDKLDGHRPIRIRKDVRQDFPLRHTLVVCGQCSRQYTASYTTKKKGYKRGYYRCNNTACPEHTKSIPMGVIEGQFEAILEGIKPKPLVLKISEAMLYDQWEIRVANRAVSEKNDTGEIARLKSEISDYAKLAKRAKSERVRSEYEKQMEETAAQMEKLNEKYNPANKRKVEFRTALCMVFDYLENPYSKWKNGDLSERSLVMSLVFEDVLFYDRGIGFRTAPLALPLRVFEHFATSKSQGVEAGGVEPPSKV